MFGEPNPHHDWLMQLVGEWSYSSECDMGQDTLGEDKPREKLSGRESVKALGPFWVIGESEGDMPGGGTAHMRITLGHDPLKGFVGTWIGSMMPNLWIYDGTLSPDGKSLTLAAEGPGMSGEGALARYEDIVTILSPTERTMTSRVQKPDGTWKEFVWIRYAKA